MTDFALPIEHDKEYEVAKAHLAKLREDMIPFTKGKGLTQSESVELASLYNESIELLIQIRVYERTRKKTQFDYAKELCDYEKSAGPSIDTEEYDKKIDSFEQSAKICDIHLMEKGLMPLEVYAEYDEKDGYYFVLDDNSLSIAEFKRILRILNNLRLPPADI